MNLQRIQLLSELQNKDDARIHSCRPFRNGSELQRATEMATRPDYGAFIQKFELKLTSSSNQLPLNGLTFAVKDLFDIEGHVTGFGNPEWASSHSAATSTAAAVLALLKGGATCVGKTILGEMAYCLNGVNKHYGTPVNPCAPDCLPGGSSSGSAVAVAAKIVDFSLGSDTGGSVRAPASYCNILGFRPSHGVVSVSGVLPMAQSFDTVGWFARDPVILNRVGRILLHLPEVEQTTPSRIFIAEDCFQFSSIPNNLVRQVLVKSADKLFGGDVVKNVILGDYVEKNVPSLRQFMSEEMKDQDEYTISSLAGLSKAMRLLQRYEFRNNHGEWVTTVKPNLGPGPSKLIWKAIQSTGENIDAVKSVMTELRAALTTLLQDSGILAIPTIPGHPPKLDTYLLTLETFRAQAFSLLSIAGMSGFCQVSIPLGMHDGLPVSLSLLAKHGSDGFLLNVVETLYNSLQEEFAMLNQ